ncbi:hypothetical protein HZS55_09015 [Halosimplex rubrum]|uniref:Uncharacterized protein n=1 Tax=Halosimplex rubrum TaxID=869889 RepID=A0A7D5NZX0_9EURY|nr:hypothetical protein [Halosimplex rubrum]QLH77426.1 hypothetical protein HZS55_09015 [Halosimplex rubrum]
MFGLKLFADESEVETAPEPVTTDIDADDLFEALRSDRRRRVVRAVAELETVDLGDLTEVVASEEYDCAIADLTHQERKRVYVSLYQTHLPEARPAGDRRRGRRPGGPGDRGHRGRRRATRDRRRSHGGPAMTSVDRVDVRDAVRSLDERGRTHIKSRHVAAELGLDADPSTCKSIGKRLAQLADRGVVERWSGRKSSNGTTWQIRNPGAGIRADGGMVMADSRPSDITRTDVTDEIASVTIHIIADGRDRTLHAEALAEVANGLTDGGDYIATEIVVDHSDLEEDAEKDLLRGLSGATVEYTDGGSTNGSVPYAKTDGAGDYTMLVVSLQQPVVITDGGQDTDGEHVPADELQTLLDRHTDTEDEDPVPMTDGGTDVKTPSSRDYVEERLEQKPFVSAIEPCGLGLRVSIQGTEDHTFTNLMETHRWYLANINTDGGKAILMPVPEPDDEVSGGDDR